MDLIQITTQYSNSVLVAILPFISSFAQTLHLEMATPVTPAQVAEFRCSPRRGEVGGMLILTNGFCFTGIP
jgi:hypothetical protein